MKRLLLLVGLLFWSCEDERVEIPVVDIDEVIEKNTLGINNIPRKSVAKAILSPDK